MTVACLPGGHSPLDRFTRFTARVLLRQSDAALDFSRGWQRFGERRREGVGDQHPVLGHPDRPADIAGGVFDHDPVAVAAKDQADARAVPGLPLCVVERGEIEVHLARVLGLEGTDLEIDGDQTLNLRESLCRSDFSTIQGAPRCRQTVRRSCSNLKRLSGVQWWPVSMAGTSPRTQARCCWDRSTGASVWCAASRTASSIGATLAMSSISSRRWWGSHLWPGVGV